MIPTDTTSQTPSPYACYRPGCLGEPEASDCPASSESKGANLNGGEEYIAFLAHVAYLVERVDAAISKVRTVM